MKKFRFCIGVLLVLSTFVGMLNLTTETAEAGTVKSGSISADETWDMAGSPYWIENDVTIEAGVTLTIYPGVDVKFDGPYYLRINGNLTAIGNEVNQINITSNLTSPDPADWRYIQVQSSGHAEIKYCNISYARDGIMLYSSNNNITNNSVKNNYYGISLYSSSNNNITGNNVSKNGYLGNGGYGIYLDSSSNNTIQYNYILDNDWDGIRLESSSRNAIINNSIILNDWSGIRITSSPNNTIIENEVWDNIRILSSSHNTTLSKNHVYSTMSYGIYVSSSNNWINNNRVHNINGDGILLSASSNNIISNNTIYYVDSGIYLSQNSLNNTITVNSLYDNDYGIDLADSSNNLISNNTALSNDYDGIIIHILSLSSNKNIISNNNVSLNSRHGINLFTSSNNQVSNNNISSNDDYGVYVHSSTFNNTIINNTITSNDYGIYLVTSTVNNTILNNDLISNGYGIYISDFLSHNNTISINNISSNNWDGLNIRSPDNLISKNIVSDNNRGLYFSGARDNIITYNDIYLNTNEGIEFSGGENNEITNNNITKNNIGIENSGDNSIISYNNISQNTNIGIYLRLFSANYNTITNNIIWKNKDGIYMESSSNNNTIEYNNITWNYEEGIYLDDVMYNNISNNNISNNENGLYLYISYNNTFSNNTISGNSDNGAYLSASWNNTFLNNNISENNYGFYFFISGQYNLIFHNNIIDNTNQVDDPIPSDTYWHHPVLLEGNYWSDYTGLDDGSGAGKHAISSDGIGDTLIPHPTTDYDFYPLMDPIDTIPPTIMNLLPPHASITTDNMPTISADYSDLSGINTSSVILIIDGVDQTSYATVLTAGVSYIPATSLSNDVHNVYLEVRDASINKNLAIKVWSFRVDTIGPAFTNLEPPNGSIANDNKTTISANYSDPSGIVVSSVLLIVDSNNETSNATITASGVSYIPSMALTEGLHTVTLAVKDTLGNLATVTWNFNVDTTPDYSILKQGWNLISIPLIQEEQNVTKVLTSIDDYYDAVQWYDNTDKSDPWKHHKVGKPFGNDLSEINETIGFWIHITQPGDTIFIYNGTQPSQNQTITLNLGWNLVGYPSLSNLNRTDGLNNITFGSDVDAIWSYNATLQKWVEIGESDYFKVGGGYWIHALSEKTWELPL